MMISFRQFLFAITIIYVLPVNGASNHCPDGEEDNGSGCVTCKEGSYRNGAMPVCQIFKNCVPETQAVLFPGNKTHDTVCYCIKEPFTVIYGDQCYPTCPAGKYFVTASCKPCPPGKWKNFTGTEECLSCTQCNETFHECNSTNDAICARSAVVNGSSTVAKSENLAQCGNFSTGAIAVIIIASVFIVILIIVLVVKYKDKDKNVSSTKQQSPFVVEGGPISNHEDPESTIPLRSINADGASNNPECS